MIERGFLIHRGYTITEIYRLNSLLVEIDEILGKAEKNRRQISTIEMTDLDLTWKAVEEMTKNIVLKDSVYFRIKQLKGKIESLQV